MRRRQFIAGLAGTLVTPGISFAQRTRMRVIGVIAGGPQPKDIQSSGYGSIPKGLAELGYVEGQDFTIEWRFANGHYDRFPEFAAEMVRLNVDVIVLPATGQIPDVQKATSTIPIVMGHAVDPVGNGFVKSLARPGGNITGLAASSDDAVPKLLELIKACVPNLSKLGVLAYPNSPTTVATLKTLRSSIERIGTEIVLAGPRDLNEIEQSLAILADQKVAALYVVSDTIYYGNRQRLADLALLHRMPAAFSQQEYVEAGGLLSYGEKLADFWRRSTVYIDKIFKGAKPSDLPVEQPTRFHLLINLKTAKTLSIEMPGVVLAAADEVIE